MWIYVLGERNGTDIKIGHTKDACVNTRLREVDRDQMTNHTYVMLAAVASTADGERLTKRYFANHRAAKGTRTEYFHPADEIVEWALWLRQQWYVSFDPADRLDEAFATHPSEWIPTPERRVPPPSRDPAKIVQDHEQLTGHLAGTAWAWMPDMLASFQDYFTDPAIVHCAWNAMGGIDGDAASHWIANKRLRQAGLEIGDYLHINKSAFEHDWFNRTWLNPPYGDNDRWFRRAIEMLDAGTTEQLCMLSPVYAFTTGIAQQIMRRSQAMVLLSPTPKFFNPGDPKRDGTNLPHAVVYWGARRDAFLEAFAQVGIPVTVASEALALT